MNKDKLITRDSTFEQIKNILRAVGINIGDEDKVVKNKEGKVLDTKPYNPQKVRRKAYGGKLSNQPRKVKISE